MMARCHNAAMNPAWLESITDWIGTHPIAAGALIFLIAFCDALVIVGIVVPALPLLFAAGALIGLGHINGPYALVCAAAGAFLGDALSYWFGRHLGPQRLRGCWPFVRYPQWLDRGETMFRRHGVTSILIARFVGAVRPFVPAIAGMLHMPIKRYAIPSAFASVAWAGLFLAPGWILGASYDAVAAVADRLALALGGLAAAIALAWALVLYSWRWFAQNADLLLARLLRWTRRHPLLGRYATALVDPNRPESASLAMLAMCLLAISWGCFALLATLLASGGPLAIDHHLNEVMWGLRNPLADGLMAGLASLGDMQVLGAAAAMALAYLLWRRRWMAAAHWLAALVFGLALTALLEAVIDMPRPPTAPPGFGFPSVAVTMTTIVFGFFAVLIARELPGRKRVWPYLLAGVITAVVAFARLYLGAHWFSDLIGSTLFGLVWLLILGIAYRSHVARSFWMRPLAAVFYTTFVVAGLLHSPGASDRLLPLFVPAGSDTRISSADWWRDGWKQLPAQRNENDPRRRWPLDVQIASPLAPLQAAMEAAGWQVQPQADWATTLNLLDDDTPIADQVVLPATLDAHAETLLMLRPGPTPTERYALRLWPAPATLDDGTPLWLGTTQTLHLSKPLNAVVLWLPSPHDGQAHALVLAALADTDLEHFDMEQDRHPYNGVPVARLRAR